MGYIEFVQKLFDSIKSGNFVWHRGLAQGFGTAAWGSAYRHMTAGHVPALAKLRSQDACSADSPQWPHTRTQSKHTHKVCTPHAPVQVVHRLALVAKVAHPELVQHTVPSTPHTRTQSKHTHGVHTARTCGGGTSACACRRSCAPRTRAAPGTWCWARTASTLRKQEGECAISQPGLSKSECEIVTPCSPAASRGWRAAAGQKPARGAAGQLHAAGSPQQAVHEQFEGRGGSLSRGGCFSVLNAGW